MIYRHDCDVKKERKLNTLTNTTVESKAFMHSRSSCTSSTYYLCCCFFVLIEVVRNIFFSPQHFDFQLKSLFLAVHLVLFYQIFFFLIFNHCS